MALHLCVSALNCVWCDVRVHLCDLRSPAAVSSLLCISLLASRFMRYHPGMAPDHHRHLRRRQHASLLRSDPGGDLCRGPRSPWSGGVGHRRGTGFRRRLGRFPGTDTPPGIDRYGSQPGGEKQWWGAFLREVLRRLDHDAAWEPLLDELYAAFSRPEVWHVYPETRATLEAIHQRGLMMAVISNWDGRLPEILAGLDLTDWFAEVTVSTIEGVEKPGTRDLPANPRPTRCQRLGDPSRRRLALGGLRGRQGRGHHPRSHRPPGSLRRQRLPEDLQPR